MDKIVLNNKEVTSEQFEKEKKKIESKKGVVLKEVQPGNFKTEIRG